MSELETGFLLAPEERSFPVENGKFLIFRKVLTRNYYGSANNQIIDINLNNTSVDINRCIVNASIIDFSFNHNARYRVSVNGFRLTMTRILQIDYSVYLDPNSENRLHQIEFSGIVAYL